MPLLIGAISGLRRRTNGGGDVGAAWLTRGGLTGGGDVWDTRRLAAVVGLVLFPTISFSVARTELLELDLAPSPKRLMHVLANWRMVRESPLTSTARPDTGLIIVVRVPRFA